MIEKDQTIPCPTCGDIKPGNNFYPMHKDIIKQMSIFLFMLQLEEYSVFDVLLDDPIDIERILERIWVAHAPEKMQIGTHKSTHEITSEPLGYKIRYRYHDLTVRISRATDGSNEVCLEWF